MTTVVARFHHPSRDLAEIEQNLLAAGAEDALITSFTVVLTVEAASRDTADKLARQLLDKTGASKVKILKHRPKKALA